VTQQKIQARPSETFLVLGIRHATMLSRLVIWFAERKMAVEVARSVEAMILGKRLPASGAPFLAVNKNCQTKQRDFYCLVFLLKGYRVSI
jgi:hypothetical protein